MAEDKLKCDLCQSQKKNELKYGKFYVKNKLKVHYFCLLLSTGLAQEGDDDEGILGFLPMDIQAEKRRIKQKMCIYCKEKGANISCCEAKCKNNFHFICGINNGAQNHFLDTFPSFCHQHADNPKKYKKSSKEACSICWESFSRNEPQTMAISTPCCKNGWFHKWCLQEFANKAGYFFKCPLCNDTSIFSREIPKSGIFIPQKDADWELEPGAFEDLLVRPSECSARQCACKSGRNFTNDELFKFLLCQICGGKAIHKFCHVGNWKMSDEKYLCLECSDMVNKLNLHEYSKDSGIVVINKNNFENDVINIEDSLDSDENLTDEDKQVNQISSNYFSEDFVLCNRNDSVEKKGKRRNRKRQKR
ncbi:PHD finger protein 7-like [Condylostylus longicornis]|uniref:PHD finger protein 7-like n=1 Tax=Condylostylus longicornis TaxID=2530218 RepID=UPI00244DC611|nr:PHD finger protein 7-like [Condylostylus longicornis]